MHSRNFNSKEKLASYIKKTIPAIYHGSQTSVVIPYGNRVYEEGFNNIQDVVNLSSLEKNLAIKDNVLSVSGPVTWEEANIFCRQRKKQIMVNPTETSAQLLSGVATSATGERSFHYGPLRNSIINLKFINYNGEEIALNSDQDLLHSEFFSSPSETKLLQAYQKDWNKYSKFKNGPFPRLEKMTDLMIGTEGQLGVITEAEFKVVDAFKSRFFFVQLPNWEKSFAPHYEIYRVLCNNRDVLIALEFIDSNSIKIMGPDFSKFKGGRDFVFMEVNQEKIDDFMEVLLNQLGFNLSKVFEIKEEEYKNIRLELPRAVAEFISANQLSKIGTDVQVSSEDFQVLISKYRHFSDFGFEYCLFGHFGDAHLHFNFLPKEQNSEFCQKAMSNFYKDLVEITCSPFAEHGIGLLKKKHITQFYGSNQLALFKYLKKILDPFNQFFPTGFMSIKDKSINLQSG